MTDRVEKGHIELLDARVKKTKQYRFVVLDPNEEVDPDESRSVDPDDIYTYK